MFRGGGGGEGVETKDFCFANQAFLTRYCYQNELIGHLIHFARKVSGLLDHHHFGDLTLIYF